MMGKAVHVHEHGHGHVGQRNRVAHTGALHPALRARVRVRVRARLFLCALLLGFANAGLQAQDATTESRRTAIVRASERVAPAVVSVNVLRRESVQPRSLWESFFLSPGTREVQGLGSGFIIERGGTVLTNEHVVRGATEVVVTLSDGRDFPADVVGTDEVTDLAVLRLRNPPANLPTAPLGTSSNLIIGEWVIAIGNPFGFLLSNAEPTVTAGVVSGVGRNIVPGGTDEGRGYYLDMIQTDASINPGNSGGPLINALGQVIGVNSSIISQSGGSVGLGFAIPIDRARRIADDLVRAGRVQRAWLGATVEPADPNAFGRSNEVRVAQVAPGSPAAQAGLRVGMTIVSFNGRRVANPLDWEARMLDMRVGESAELAVREHGRARTLRVVAGGLPSLAAERIRVLAQFELVTLTPAIRAERRLRSQQGALIVSLPAEAQRIGLQEGDLIVGINRVPIRSAEEVGDLLRRASGRTALRITFERQGQLGSTPPFYIDG
jgi:serine protease Do